MREPLRQSTRRPARHRACHGAAPGAVALALAVLLAVGTFLSAVALGREVHHRCTGDDCPVCQLMAGAAKAAGRSSTPVPQPPRIPSARLGAVSATPLTGVVLVASSPVSLGVRLDI